MSPQTYMREHRFEVWRFLKHIGPYFAIAGTIIGALVAAGWLDLPARSQNVKRLATQVSSAKKELSLVGKATGQLTLDIAVQTQKIEAIDDKVESVDGKLDLILEQLIAR